MSKTKDYLSAEEFDLMFEDELDSYFDDEYYYQLYLQEKKYLEKVSIIQDKVLPLHSKTNNI